MNTQLFTVLAMHPHWSGDNRCPDATTLSTIPHGVTENSSAASITLSAVSGFAPTKAHSDNLTLVRHASTLRSRRSMPSGDVGTQTFGLSGGTVGSESPLVVCLCHRPQPTTTSATLDVIIVCHVALITRNRKRLKPTFTQPPVPLRAAVGREGFGIAHQALSVPHGFHARLSTRPLNR